jgi:hypothetical protein
MAKFVQSVANQQMPPPYTFPGATVHAFVFEAPMTAVQAYCDRYFNLGEAGDRGFIYRPLSIFPYATLMVIEYPMMVCMDTRQFAAGETPFADRGYTSQNEVFVAVPLARHGVTPANFLLDDTVEWALPFIAVDNSTSAFSGREMLGLEKLKGTITLGDGLFPDSFSAKVGLPGWPSLDPTAVQRMLPFLEIKTHPALPTFRGSPNETSVWSLLRSKFAGGVMQGLSAAVDGLDAIMAGLLPAAMEVVALKQFRDAEDPRKAVYQALVATRSRYYNITDLRFYNETDVSIVFKDGGSFGEIIRVFLDAPENASPLKAAFQDAACKPRAAFRFKTDIDFDDMRTLHTFPVDDQPAPPPGPSRVDSMISPWLRPLRAFWSKP